MKLIRYIIDALKPGGTPKRYLEWVSVILIAQTLSSILPSPMFYEPFPNLSHMILITTIVISIGVNIVKQDNGKIIAAYVLYILGLILSTVTISTGITSLSGIVFLLTWAMTLFISERREYITFDWVTVFMVLMLISAIVLLMFNPSQGVNKNWIVLAVGGLATAIDIFLVYNDFGYNKNYYEEYRKRYADLQILSTNLSDILSSEGDIEDLLWQVTQKCVPFLGLEECVIYLYDDEKGKLVQVAAYGDKSTRGQQILDPIDIEPGHGIVGKTFVNATYTLVEEAQNHPDYIVDNEERNSELAVPILSNGKVIGILDSEHSVRGFFLERHVQAFQVIASFCGIKITESLARNSILKVEKLELEAIHYKELDELKNRFITNISHDLKTPLSLIKAPAIQIEKLATDERIKKHSNYILKNTEHLLRVVGQLLQLNRVDLGLNDLYIDEVNIEKLINKLAIQYQGLAAKDNITFHYQASPAIVVTDTFRLEQIVHNLVHNAFRYTGRNGRVELSAIVTNEILKLTVSDNGPGISSELQEKVFDRFFKADENNHEGTGIGLSLVKEYTNSLRGSVDLKSVEGEGTTFEVLIPTSIGPQKDVPEEVVMPELGTNGKPIMLVVEDHADLNDFICTFFEDDFECISAFDGEEALEKIAQQSPDIVISDLMMPKMDGGTFVQKIKSSEEHGHIPVVVLSAKSQTESRISLYKIGADNYLMKPFDNDELSAVVNNLLEQRKKVISQFHANYLSVERPVEVAVSSEPVEEKDELITIALDYIKARLDDSEFSVTTMAKELGISRNRFQSEIKKLTSLTPVEFVRSVRLSEAKKMLLDKQLTISEVAYSVGFNNLSYFTRSFKSEFGMLPSKWREKGV